MSDTAETSRGIAWRVLSRVERDRAYADLTLHDALRGSGLERRDRALATELTYGALRLRGRLDHALGQVLDRDLEETEIGVRSLLRLGAYQILCLDRIPPATAVDQTVELARQVGLGRASGMVNAVLRQLLRRLEAGSLSAPRIEEDALGHVSDYLSLPRWLAARWIHEHGPESAAALARVLCQPPPRTVRLSPGVDRDVLARRLGGRACDFAPAGVTDCGVDPTRDPGFRTGEFSIQDEASQLVADLLGAGPGDSVVDCCAAPGGKAVQLGQIVGAAGEVIALELHEQRVGLIRREAQRLGLGNLRVLQRDVTRGFDLQGRLRFGRILVDAPCTGLGTLRRNPEARWTVRAEDVELCAGIQLRILDSASRYVEAGGVLVYSVCTLTPEETSGVIEAFLDSSPEFDLDPVQPFLPPAAHALVQEDGTLRTLPHRHGCDGFFAARLVRT